MSKQLNKRFEEIAKRPISDTSFPAHLAPIVKLKEALESEDTGFSDISNIVRLDPMLSTKILIHANSAYNPPTNRIATIERAIIHIGIKNVKRIALTVSLEQLTKSKEILAYSSLSRVLWKNTMYRSVAMEVFTHAFSSSGPIEASIRGMFSSLGAFALIYYYGKDELLKDQVVKASSAIAKYYSKVTDSILDSETLGTPVPWPRELKTLYKDRYSEEALLCYSIALADDMVPWYKERPSIKALPKEHMECVPRINELYEKVLKDYNP